MKNNDYYNALLNSLPASYQAWFEEEKKFLESNIKTDATVLEVGSGDGRSIFDLLPITKNIVGVDHDDNAIKTGKESFKDYESIKFVKAEAEDLPFENDSFDYIICMSSFANFSDKKYRILEEMKRVLKSDGRIIISTYSEKALSERLNIYKNLKIPTKEIKENGTVVFDDSLGDNISEQFSKEELISIFETSGLQVDLIKEVDIAYLCLLKK